MLHAPLTLTTAKLDISLLLKSSPSPPASAAAEIYPFVTRSTSLPTTTSQSLPQLSSHGTSPSSGVSITNSHAASRTPSQSYSQPQRTVLPPLRAPSPFLSPRNSARGLPATSNYTQTGHPPAKRPPPTQNHPSASPAKKQSKWTAEEDALIIDLRGSGMKWEDISKRLPGRSAISCRLHYQNYLERRSEWDEEKKNRLARLYERLKQEMWAPLATELGIPWRAAEAMHWQLGENEMARRAGVNPFSLAVSSAGSSGSVQQQRLSGPGPNLGPGSRQPSLLGTGTTTGTIGYSQGQPTQGTHVYASVHPIDHPVPPLPISQTGLGLAPLQERRYSDEQRRRDRGMLPGIAELEAGPIIMGREGLRERDTEMEVERERERERQRERYDVRRGDGRSTRGRK